MVLLEMLDCLIYRAGFEAITLNELECNLQVFDLLLQFCYLLRLLFDNFMFIFTDHRTYSIICIDILIVIFSFASTKRPTNRFVFTCNDSGWWVSCRLEEYASFEIFAKLHDVVVAEV